MGQGKIIPEQRFGGKDKEKLGVLIMFCNYSACWLCGNALSEYKLIYIVCTAVRLY